MKRAFTLIEVLIVSALAGLIIVALTDLLIKYDSVFATQKATVDVDTSANEIVSQVTRAALQASSVAASHTFSGTTYSSGGTSLVLAVPAVDSSGNIITGSTDYIGFYATGTSAYEATDPASGSNRLGGARLLSDVLSSLTFTYSTTTITSSTSTIVDVVTQTKVGATTLSRHLREQINLENL